MLDWGITEELDLLTVITALDTHTFMYIKKKKIHQNPRNL